jgi:hypothetical protein
MKHKILLIGLVFFGFSALARADDDKPAKVPFETLKTQHIVVKIKINGKGPYRVIFDTGAPVSLINTRTAEDAGVAEKGKMPGLPLFGEIPQFKMKTLEIGDLKAEDVSTTVMNHPTVTAIDKVMGPVDGILGLSFFGKYRLTIDYQAKEMTFVPVKFRPPDVMKNLLTTLTSGAPEKKVLAPAGQWGFSVSKDAKDEDAGVVVKTVLPESPVAKAGLKVGDRLMTLDGRWTDSVADCYSAASYVRPGSAARLVIVRDGKEMELKVTVQTGL